VADLLTSLEQHREAILLGEFGGLLHMFGKASSEFLRAHSLEGDPKDDSHQDLKHLGGFAPLLQTHTLTDRFAFTVGAVNEKLAGDFTDFIRKYKGTGPDSHLLRLFNTCHRMTSADEKGVVRRKQSIASMRVATPFGRRVRPIIADEVDNIRTKMSQDLAGALNEYLRGQKAIDSFRECAIQVLRPGLSLALGETREPANDVTLWAQSWGVASLYKSCLAAIAIGSDPCPKTSTGWDYDKVQWRLLGIGWNGLAFLQRGRKAADILRRREIIDIALERLGGLLEVTYPVGNLFYKDLNGAFFTFPGIDQNTAETLMAEAGPELVRAVREASDNELWPSFTLSRPRRTLTIIAREIRIREKLAAAPCVAAVLSVENEQPGAPDRIERLLAPGPPLPIPSGRDEDVCPVCRFRSKPTVQDACKVCRDRRTGRQGEWLSRSEGETIWVNEIADANNRMALLTLRFDLSRWLSGEWFTTIFTQAYDDWSRGRRLQSSLRRLKEFIDKGQISRLEGSSPSEAARSLAAWVVANPRRTECKPAFESFMEDGEIASVASVLDDIRDLYGAVNEETVLSQFFTQNPSPGRLARTWEAAQDFIGHLIAELRDKIFFKRPERLRFRATADVSGVEEGGTYRIAIPELQGGPVVVLALNRREFSTIDCLAKFQWSNDRRVTGLEAVRHALETRGVQSWRDEDTGETIAGPSEVKVEPVTQRYLPFAVLADSPVLSQLLLPASRIPDVLKAILDLEDEHFGAVGGKLVLHAGVLVAKRKFPLYTLLEAGQQILNHPAFGEGSQRRAWFPTDCGAEFYRHYPTEKPEGDRHRITSLAPLTAGRQYWLTNGYFDFDFLGGTVDRHRLQYKAASPPFRPTVTYGWLHPRPIPLPRLREVFAIWTLLSKIGPTQRYQIEAALSSKLEQWRAVADGSRVVFEKFAGAVLRDAFGGKSWNAMRDQDRQLLQSSAVDGQLLDTIQFFEHVVKGEFAP
jgi:hypothetical protein